MPVVDGTFIPRSPLTLAEQQVDFAAADNHILDRRARIEHAARPAARRLAYAVAHLGYWNQQEQFLATRLEREVAVTASFGFHEAQREISRLRSGRDRVTAADIHRPVPDAGMFGWYARHGLYGVLLLARNRAYQIAAVVASAAVTAASEEKDKTVGALAATGAAARALHNGVLDIVGEVLNVGRTAGALAIPNPPEFALRSEQLDKTTCDPCARAHGEIAQVDSSEYYAILPPNFCLGGGRCRGLMVFGDGVRDVRQPDLLAA